MQGGYIINQRVLVFPRLICTSILEGGRKESLHLYDFNSLDNQISKELKPISKLEEKSVGTRTMEQLSFILYLNERFVSVVHCLLWFIKSVYLFWNFFVSLVHHVFLSCILTLMLISCVSCFCCVKIYLQVLS